MSSTLGDNSAEEIADFVVDHLISDSRRNHRRPAVAVQYYDIAHPRSGDDCRHGPQLFGQLVISRVVLGKAFDILHK